MFRRFLNAAFMTLESQTWQPSVDVYRVPNGWLLKFELAGVASDDVEVTTEGNRVIVRGVRLDRCQDLDRTVHQMEIPYHVFERIVELPEDLTQTAFQLEFSNGMLFLRLTRVSQ